MYYLKDKTVLITGVAGSIGTALVKRLTGENLTKKILGLDNNETGVTNLVREYERNYNAEFMFADVRDYDSIINATKGVDIIIHTAALKHVSVSDIAPMETVRTNIIGTNNVINAALKNGVERVLFTSSDKAVHPTNGMGASKQMGESLVLSADRTSVRASLQTRFMCTRFGNVLGSSGSVLPIFKAQLHSGQDLTLTDPEMSRFVMNINDAVDLVLNSLCQAEGGEIFVTKMATIKIIDLAEVLLESYFDKHDSSGKKSRIVIVGAKPGEKLYEELMTAEEAQRARETDRYYIIRSLDHNFRSKSDNKLGGDPYSNNTPQLSAYDSRTGPFMSKELLYNFLSNSDLLI